MKPLEIIAHKPLFAVELGESRSDFFVAVPQELQKHVDGDRIFKHRN